MTYVSGGLSLETNHTDVGEHQTFKEGKMKIVMIVYKDNETVEGRMRQTRL